MRTRKEAKLLLNLQNLKINVPKLLDSSDKTMEIKMQFIPGKRVSEVLDLKNYKMICCEIGRIVAVLHQNNIIHGYLTTSNFILSGKKIFVIDFGLSFTSIKIEDKAVDIHLFKQALESKHYTIHEKAFSEFVKSYKKEEMDAKEVLKRLELVEGRGRYKH
jgi:TP53 regulating kinase-like protein